MKKLVISATLYFLALSLFAPNMVVNTDYFTKKYGSLSQSFSTISNNKSINDSASIKYFYSLDKIWKHNPSVIKLYKLEDKDIFANVVTTFNTNHEFTIENNFGPYLINDSKVFNQNSTRLSELN
jgi:hypothetical protein